MPLVEVGDDRGTKVWDPTPRQRDFITLPDTLFEGFYGGAAGGGKSEILLMLPIVKQWYQNPRFHGIIFRRTFPQLEESLIPRSNEYYKPLGATYDATKHVWTFPSGATMRFSYMLKKDDARQHDTAEYNYAAFDELTHFDEFQYLYITSRVRTSDPSLPALVRSASNPGNVGHLWVRNRFVQPAKTGYVILYDSKSQTKRIFIPAKLTDNVHLLRNDPTYANRLLLLPEAEKRAKLDGDWWTFAGMVFEEFRSEHLNGEPDHAIHVVDPFDVPLWWTRIAAIDWGYQAMVWIGWFALAPNKRVYLYREYAEKRKYISEWASDFARLTSTSGEVLESVVIDPSARQQRGDPKSILQQFSDHSGYTLGDAESGRLGVLRLADNDRLSGKLLIHEFLRWSEKPARIVPQTGFDLELSQQILRRKGRPAYNEYVSLFMPEETEVNLPKLQIFKSCPMVIDTIPICVYADQNSSKAVDKVAEDVAEFAGDDPYDGLRYGLKEVIRVINDSPETLAKNKQIDEIVAQYRLSGDVTRYYRRMEQYESAEAGQRPVALFNRPRSRRRYRVH